MRFVSGAPAAVAGKNLVLADLHLGIEFELRRKGIMVGIQWSKVAEEVNGLLKQTRATGLIILGDAKHDVHGFEAREKIMMEDFFAALDCKQKVVVTKGNHDGGLGQLTEITVTPPEGFVKKIGGKKYGFVHGHARPAPELFQADFLLTAHSHPVIEFRDPLGFRWTEPAWIMGETKTNKELGSRSGQKTIIFPAFSKMAGGLAMNAIRETEYLGPLLRNKVIDVENAEAVLVSGVRLGKIKSLKKTAEFK